MSAQSYPAPGHIYEADFGGLAFHLRFHDDGKTMQFKPAAAPDFAQAQAVSYSATVLAPDIFMVTWAEADKTTVTHVQDFGAGRVHTNITQPDHNFLNLTGRWTRLS
ncbi:hypothetical protein HOY34_06525 [Xinfangfangia sp. D13-10-4-6]|uniref:MoaF-related domain-containing protein n=1 Tax=Pseudogemmobacter hezensis TaxID=2737662 RepID=UPI001557979E|nr:hypothetical protein [Pseudogemmobacter hezensis]NPD14861.1 hypothetical protein [Pseudogemmobacter hezensis]